MEEKNEIENYLKKLYEFYEKNNYKYFVEKCLSFNIKIGDYNKNISSLSKKVYNLLLEKINSSECKGVEYCEKNNFYYLNVKFDNNIFNINKIIVDVPIFEENYEFVAELIFKYLFENKFNFNMKFYKLLKNSFFKLEFYDFVQFKRFSEFFNMNSEINSIVKSRVIPFLNKSYYLGVYTEISTYSFKNFYIKNLYMYYEHYSINPLEDGVTLEGFFNYISNKTKLCKNLNEKRMYSILLNYLDISINSKNLSYLFEYNTVMNIGSYNPNDYLLKLDQNKMIFFISKDDGEEIRYGSEDFLNIVYSKYYENVIKKETSNKYYYDFYSIYNIILSSHYKEIDCIFSLLNEKMDIINRLLIILSSAYFAYKKMNFPLKVVYLLLDKIIPNVYDYNASDIYEIRNIEDKVNYDLLKSSKSNEYVLSDDLANKLVSLSDGKKVAFKDYLDKYDVLNNIKTDTVIHLKDGSIINGKDFIDDLYKYISFYNNFSDLFEDLVLMLEYK